MPTMEEVRSYLEAHGVREKLEVAVRGAITDGADDPMAYIAAALVAPPPIAPEALPASAPPRFFLGANWKCKIERRADAVALCAALVSKAALFPSDVEIVLFVPVLLIDACCRALGSCPRFSVGAQNVWDAGPMGAHTGCTTASMLADCGVRWVMLGHSDRRNTLGESSELIGQKAAAALAAGLNVNVTVGETKAQRDAGEHLDALSAQLAPLVAAMAAQASDPEGEWSRVVLAYEPVWAIGEGATPCSPEEMQVVHAHLRSYIADNASASAAERVRIAYTGSVSPANAASYRALPECEGFVCGRASLNADEFVAVATAGKE